MLVNTILKYSVVLIIVILSGASVAHSTDSSLKERQKLSGLLKNYDIPLAVIEDECSNNALTAIMPICEQGGIDQKVRMRTAIDLTICLFLDSYPSKCDASIYDLDQLKNINVCVDAIKKNPQLWTTYFGYYKLVDQLCYSFRLPYEQKIIVEQYKNVFRDINQMVSIIDLINTEEITNILIKWNEWHKDFLNDLEETRETVLYKFQQDTERHRDSMDQHVSEVMNKFQLSSQEVIEFTEKLKNDLQTVNAFDLSKSFNIYWLIYKYIFVPLWFLFLTIYILGYILKSSHVYLITIITIGGLLLVSGYPFFKTIDSNKEL